ncbi:restriction system-associated AAA family ATPase [Marinomonas sp. 2405UD66-6]|uniref:restriction system-associated AAA family ATPase n=1 Tax=Marinomonas sp. 2405UD66-6 TaxID=3391834 RepID=UPI0039C93E0B
MKLLRLKITDPAGFRSLQTGFEHSFRTPWHYEEEVQKLESFAPFICAGPNGSGKSNILEALASIFYQLEISRIRRFFLPEGFLYDEEENPNGFEEKKATPNGFELEYLIKVPDGVQKSEGKQYAHVLITKKIDATPVLNWVNAIEFESDTSGFVTDDEKDFLLPKQVLAYSSGENEILSLPFFKMRFIQFDEYWDLLKSGSGRYDDPKTRLAYLDNSFSQSILLCNLLFQDHETLKPFREEVGIEELKEFRVIIKRSIDVTSEVAEQFKQVFDGKHPRLKVDDADIEKLSVTYLLESNEDSDESFDSIIDRLRRCATCSFEDESTDSLYLDFYVNDATRTVFQNNFSSALELFQAFQVLLTLNLYTVSNSLKKDLYHSDSLYVSEIVPTLASDERIMRFKNVWLQKHYIDQPVLLKSLSDGEHQLLHTLGLCLLFKDTESLFLLDEPETHFNPQWRANFISRLEECFQNTSQPEMLITTHTPFLISDSESDKVMVFKKDQDTGKVSVSNPDYNTLGASINKITMSTFEKGETIGGRAYTKIKNFEQEFDHNEKDKHQLLREIDQQLGDSIEKMLLVKTILDSMEEGE